MASVGVIMISFVAMPVLAPHGGRRRAPASNAGMVFMSGASNCKFRFVMVRDRQWGQIEAELD